VKAFLECAICGFRSEMCRCVGRNLERLTRNYRNACSERDSARADAIEQAARLLEDAAERIKHTRHVDGLGMGWRDGEDLLKEQAAAIRALPQGEGKP
jgi:uncharacterized ferredoxin-like protein